MSSRIDSVESSTVSPLTRQVVQNLAECEPVFDNLFCGLVEDGNSIGRDIRQVVGELPVGESEVVWDMTDGSRKLFVNVFNDENDGKGVEVVLERSGQHGRSRGQRRDITITPLDLYLASFYKLYLVAQSQDSAYVTEAATLGTTDSENEIKADLILTECKKRPDGRMGEYIDRELPKPMQDGDFYSILVYKNGMPLNIE